MKINIIYNGVPNSSTGGGAFTIFSIVKQLKDLGNEVSSILIINDSELTGVHKQGLEIYKSMVDQLEIVALPQKKKSIFEKIISKFLFSLVSIYPEYSVAEQVKKLVDKIKPDQVLVYHFEALAAAYQVKGIPKFGLVGDPPCAVISARFRYSIGRFDLKHILLLPFFPLIYWKHRYFDIKLLNSCNKVGAFAAHHAKEMEVQSGNSCKYYCTPLVDPLNQSNKKYIYREESIKKDKFKILLLGHLKGIVSVTGIELFVNEILPQLIDKIGKNSFEVNIVGSYFDSLSPSIKNELQKSGVVTAKGHVPSLDEEIFSADIFLIPTPIDLGIRVRVITGFSYGSCMAVHSANKWGIPELKDQENCLLGESGKELAEKIIDSYNGKYNLVNIGKGARATFEKYFIAEKAVDVIVEDFGNVS